MKLTAFCLGVCIGLLAFAGIGQGQPIILRTAAQQSYPKFLLGENGAIEGLGVDIMRALEAQDGQLKFAYMQKFVPWNRIQEWLAEGKIDVYFGLVRSPEREAKYFFLEPPLYPLKHVVAVRQGDTVAVASFADILQLGAAGTILTPRGSATIAYLRSQAPGLIIDAGAESVIDNIMKLIVGRGRFVYFHDLALKSAIYDYGLSDQVRVLPVHFRAYHQWAAVSRQLAPQVRDRLERALADLAASGRLAALFQSYVTWHEPGLPQ